MDSTIHLPKLGIKEIDEQHAELLACLDRLLLWVGKGRGFAAALDALHSLNDYVEKHFSYEEALLRENQYPKLEEHIEEHRKIAAEISRLTEKILQGSDDIDQEFVALIREWITTHIGIEDVEFGKAFAIP